MITFIFDGMHVEIVASDIRELFDFSINDLPFEDHASDHDEFCKIVRLDERDERPRFSRYKYELKWEFELMVDVIQRCVYHLLGGIDNISVKYAKALNAVFHGMRLDWSRTIFNRLCSFVKEGGHVGFGFLVSVILRKKGVRLGACKSITSYNYVLRKEKKRKARVIGDLSQSEGSSQATRRQKSTIVCEDLNLLVPNLGGTG